MEVADCLGWLEDTHTIAHTHRSCLATCFLIERKVGVATLVARDRSIMEETAELERTVSLSDSEKNSPGSPLIIKTYKKLSRKNSRKEKLVMNKLRRKRKKCKKTMKAKIGDLKKEVVAEMNLRKQAEKSVTTYKSISRTYWERWRWELHKRREVIQELKVSTSKAAKTILLHEIDPSMLKDPLEGGRFKETYLARGCFGIVRLQEYRSMQVAVKEFLPRSLLVDVQNEASILASLSHPYVPFLYGVCTKKLPLRIVMQFHTICGQEVSTLARELEVDRLPGTIWIILCAQLMEVLHYLHEDVGILHNDIKGDNVVLARSLSPEEDCQYQIVLIDFGKATKVTESKRYHLSDYEKGEYVRKYPHISPEVIEGDSRPHKGSDIYAAGQLLYRIFSSGCINSLDSCHKLKFEAFIEKCCSIDVVKRPKSTECLHFFEQL